MPAGGPHEIGATYTAKRYFAPRSRSPAAQSRRRRRSAPRVNGFEIARAVQCRPASEARRAARRSSSAVPRPKADEAPCAEKIISTIARKAFRRPVTDGDLEAPLQILQATAASAPVSRRAYEQGLMAILASPKFLYRTDRALLRACEPGAIYSISDLDLASRLSFFLWSSIPDDELLVSPRPGACKTAAFWKPRSSACWRIRAPSRWSPISPSSGCRCAGHRRDRPATPRSIPDFDEDLRAAFKEEMRLFLDSIFSKTAACVDLLTARLYLRQRAPGAATTASRTSQGNRYRKIELAELQPQGPARQGRHPDVHLLSQPHSAGAARRVDPREHHRHAAQPAAAGRRGARRRTSTARRRSRRARPDGPTAPIRAAMPAMASWIRSGFALENFDAVGAWRDKDRYARDLIDASGELPTGAETRRRRTICAAALTAKRPTSSSRRSPKS